MFRLKIRSSRSDPVQESVQKGSISKYLASHDLSSEDRVQHIKRLLMDEEEQAAAKTLEPNDASRFVELLDAVLEAGGLDGKHRPACVRYLARVCGWHSILPKSVKISNYQRGSEYVGGENSIIYTGTHNGKKIAIKRLNFYASDEEERRKRLTVTFCKEVMIWKHLKHPNILPLIGAEMVTEPAGGEKYEIVSEFMENGDIREFIKYDLGVNKLELLKDVAAGLNYLHLQSVVHGDLKGQNILVNQRHRACLADFGLTRIIAKFTSSGPTDPGGTALYMSPEMARPEMFGFKDTKPTKSSDVYALGIVIYETICGHRPYPELGAFAAAEKFRNKELPPRPEVGFTDSLWKIVESCWHLRREKRPSVDAVLRELNAASEA